MVYLSPESIWHSHTNLLKKTIFLNPSLSKESFVLAQVNFVYKGKSLGTKSLCLECMDTLLCTFCQSNVISRLFTVVLMSSISVFFSFHIVSRCIMYQIFDNCLKVVTMTFTF